MIKNIRKNRMGTVSFEGQFPGMRKAQDFMVYPLRDSGEIVKIQSSTRFGRLILGIGELILSKSRAGGSNNTDCWEDHKQGLGITVQLSLDDTTLLRQWIKSTGGLEVGSSVVKSDNMGALAL